MKFTRLIYLLLVLVPLALFMTWLWEHDRVGFVVMSCCFSLLGGAVGLAVEYGKDL